MKRAFEQNLNKNFPANLHKKIMRRIFILKHKNIFLAGAGLILIHFLFSIWRLWSVLIETEFLGVVKALTQDVEMDFDLLEDAIKNIISLAPAAQIIDFGISSLIVAFIALKFGKNYKILKGI